MRPPLAHEVKSATGEEVAVEHPQGDARAAAPRPAQPAKLWLGDAQRVRTPRPRGLFAAADPSEDEVRARIHRGATEVGGSCVELEAGGERLVLDLGRPLWADADQELPRPDIPGLLAGRDPNLAGVVITHGHPDHYGLLDRTSPNVPVYIGDSAARILNEAAFFTRGGQGLAPAGFLADGQPLQLGRFKVTPFLVDHSAFDAHAVLVEADGRRLFYTGDLRAHGRKPGTFQRLLDRPPMRMSVEGPSPEAEDFAAYFDICAEEVGLDQTIAIVS